MRALLCLAGLFASAAAFYCSPSWTSGPRGCYKYHETPKTWEEARDACTYGNRSRSFNLVTITSQEEDAFLVKYVEGTGFWTGGFYREHQQNWQWMWSNGQDFNYRNWEFHQTQLNNGRSNKCLGFLEHENNWLSRCGAKWSAVSCSVKLPFVCHLPYVCQLYQEPVVNKTD